MIETEKNICLGSSELNMKQSKKPKRIFLYFLWVGVGVGVFFFSVFVQEIEIIDKKIVYNFSLNNYGIYDFCAC